LNVRRIAVIGGTGFLGRRIVRRLLAHGFVVRVAARHGERAAQIFGAQSGLEALRADVGDDASVAAALADSWGVVNAASLYVEREGLTFQAVHVAAAERVAAQARRAGVTRLVHVSGIGADPNSASKYIRSRGQGELAVRHAFPGATIIRPSALIGPDDALIGGLAAMLDKFPVFPLFGRGHTKLQPAHVEDVGEAVARILEAEQPAPLYEFGGPQVFSYRALVETIARRLGRKPLLLPVAFALWRLAGAAAEMLASPPFTRNQVELMQQDNVASAGLPGFDALGIAPKGIEAVLNSLKPPSAPDRGPR
jgi:uncharacterized protein YbjT (DUF2867 family)